MKVYVGYATSLNYWLTRGMDEADRANVTHITSLNNAAYKLVDLTGLDLDSHGLYASTARGWPERAYKGSKAKRPLPTGSAVHVLVPKKACHERGEGFVRHCWTSHIPDGSFCAITRNVLVSTPEFSFLQMAGLLSETQLILVGYKMCAAYRIREDGVTIPVEPITSVSKLRSYLGKAEGCYGAKKAVRALSWIVDKARSPMEVNTSMVVSLPRRLGGYGLGKPCINYVIEASGYDAATLDRNDRKYFEIDLYWPDKRVGLEYDGAGHLIASQIRKDKRRLNCLLANGEKILVAMIDQLTDEEYRNTLLHQLAKLLGVRDVDCTSDARDALLGLLFENEFSF